MKKFRVVIDFGSGKGTNRVTEDYDDIKNAIISCDYQYEAYCKAYSNVKAIITTIIYERSKS